ncbi:MAG: hypothetical protein H6623_08225 [Bdellovibrionaceae bacterium]|nr:hypothetical protein [Pseudobdellovibrionaceae bacterium]
MASFMQHQPSRPSRAGLYSILGIAMGLDHLHPYFRHLHVLAFVTNGNRINSVHWLKL